MNFVIQEYANFDSDGFSLTQNSYSSNNSGLKVDQTSISKLQQHFQNWKHRRPPVKSDQKHPPSSLDEDPQVSPYDLSIHTYQCQQLIHPIPLSTGKFKFPGLNSQRFKNSVTPHQPEDLGRYQKALKLYSRFGIKDDFRTARLKYMDSFLPQTMKIGRNAFRLIKYRHERSGLI